MLKDKVKGDLLIIITMIILSGTIYGVHYLTFGDVKHTISGIILSLAYVPIGVLYNILILDRVMKRSRKIKLERRINVVIGSFFHEIGNSLIEIMGVGDDNVEALSCLCDINFTWSEEDFEDLGQSMKKYNCSIDIEKINLPKLRNKILKNDNFLLDLIINDSLDDYEGFNEMIMAILHLRDEFDSLFVDGVLKAEDKNHMSNDICKAYRALLIFWVEYIKNLKSYYPIMFENLIKNSHFENKCNEINRDN